MQPDTRSFVDTYSMSYPKEDRARIFEYAMTAGNEPLFAASPLQYKLKMLCQGIREAFGLKKIPGKLSMGAVSESAYGVYGKITKALSFRTIGSK